MAKRSQAYLDLLTLLATAQLIVVQADFPRDWFDRVEGLARDVAAASAAERKQRRAH